MKSLLKVHLNLYLYTISIKEGGREAESLREKREKERTT